MAAHDPATIAYLREHKVGDLLNEAVKHLAKEKPPCAVQALRDFLDGQVAMKFIREQVDKSIAAAEQQHAQAAPAAAPAASPAAAPAGGKGFLYTHQASQPSRSCSWFIAYAGLDVDQKMMDLFGKREQKEPEYVAKFPAGQVPSYEEGGFYLEEGVAIVEYLANGHACMPSCPKKRAELNKFVAAHHGGPRKSTTDILRPMLFQKDEPGIMDKVKANVEAFDKVLTKYDGLLAGKKFLLGDDISIADFLLVPELDQLVMFQPMIGDVYAKHENLKAYLARMEEVKGYKENYATMKGFFEAAMAAGEKKE